NGGASDTGAKASAKNLAAHFFRLNARMLLFNITGSPETSIKRRPGCPKVNPVTPYSRIIFRTHISK
ncbi:MAG: hypothetical protein ABL925_20080, partial [Methylococcales bacterium]